MIEYMKWLCTRKDWCNNHWGKDDRKSVKVLWTCTMKATRGAN